MFRSDGSLNRIPAYRNDYYRVHSVDQQDSSRQKREFLDKSKKNSSQSPSFQLFKKKLWGLMRLFQLRKRGSNQIYRLEQIKEQIELIDHQLKGFVSLKQKISPVPFHSWKRFALFSFKPHAAVSAISSHKIDKQTRQRILLISQRLASLEASLSSVKALTKGGFEVALFQQKKRELLTKIDKLRHIKDRVKFINYG